MKFRLREGEKEHSPLFPLLEFILVPVHFPQPCEKLWALLIPKMSCLSFLSPVENLPALKPLFISLQHFQGSFSTIMDLISKLSGRLLAGRAVVGLWASCTIPTILHGCQGHLLDKHSPRPLVLELLLVADVPSYFHHYWIPHCSDMVWLGNEWNFLVIVVYDWFLCIGLPDWEKILQINRKMKFCEIMLAAWADFIFSHYSLSFFSKYIWSI